MVRAGEARARMTVVPERRHYAAAGLVSCALIAVQISFTRLIGYKLFYHFVFLAIGLTLLGLGAAGTFVALRKRRESLDATILWWLGVFTLLAPISFLMVANPFVLASDQVLPIKLLGMDAVAYLVWCSLFMVALNFAGGVVLTEVFRQFSARMGGLYAFDLLGAGAGCLLSVALMKYLSPPIAFLCASFVAALALWPFFVAERGKDPGNHGGLLAVLGVVIAALVIGGPEHLKNFENFKTVGNGPKVHVLKHEWNHIIRTDHGDNGFYTLDGEAGTPVMRWDEVQQHLPVTDPIYTMVRPTPRVGIIGFGGGPQLAEARRAKASTITAVDINPTISHWVLNEDRAYNLDLFVAPNITVINDEGRHAIRSSGKRFDALVMHAIDTYAATAAGAYALTENFLYTKEAAEDYLGALAPGGVMSFERWLFNPPRENLRLFATILAALAERGVADPTQHVIMLCPLRNYADLIAGRQRVWGYLMMSPTPFAADKIAALRTWVAGRGWSVLYAPGGSEDTPFSRYARSKDRRAFQASHPYLISPVTDASPYLFQFYNPLSKTAYEKEPDWATASIYQSSAVLLPVSLGISLALTLLLILGPLIWARLRTKRGSQEAITTIKPRQVVFFACLGVGYMALEVPLTQALALYLGHPVYGFSVVLVALLISSGIGSLLAARWGVGRARVCAGIAIALALLTAIIFPLVHATMGLPDVVRFALALVLVSVCGLPMGAPMPLGMGELGKSNTIDVAWAWGVNAAASVVGSCVVMIVMVFLGSHYAFALAAGCYALAALASREPATA